MPSRRRILRAASAGLAGGLAGCSTTRRGSNEQVPTGTTAADTPTRSPTATQTRRGGLGGQIRVYNPNGTPTTLTVEVRRDDETIHEATLGVNPGDRRHVDPDISEPGTYEVVASSSEATTSFQWRIDADYRGDLSIEVTDDRGLQFQEFIQKQPCSDGEGDTGELPYAAPGDETTYQTSISSIVNRSGKARTIPLSVSHGETTFFDCSYTLRPAQLFELQGLTATAGDYRVLVDVEDGGRTEDTWRVPAEYSYPHLHVRLDEEGEPLVGCRPPIEVPVSVENTSADARRVELSVHEEGEAVTRREVNVSGQSKTEVPLQLPIGDIYTLKARTGTGVATGEFVECYCYDQWKTTVTVDGDGPAVESERKVCE